MEMEMCTDLPRRNASYEDRSDIEIFSGFVVYLANIVTVYPFWITVHPKVLLFLLTPMVTNDTSGHPLFSAHFTGGRCRIHP